MAEERPLSSSLPAFPAQPGSRRLHRFARFVVACTVVLVLAGSLVTSTDSGLAVPDWPTSYGWSMFTFPPAMWVGGIFYEHGHRLIASGVGFLTIVLAIWLWLADPRYWMKRLGAIALATVILQGVLGGLTVLFFLPASISTAHAGLAELFFCITVAIAVFSSPGWLSGITRVNDATLRRATLATTIVIYVQILVGATMRHSGAGLAIPDFPLMFGGVIPDHWDSKIAVHFAHRVGAFVVTLAIMGTAARVWSRHRRHRELIGPATLLATLVAVQIVLGAFTVWSRRAVWINSAHVVCGALVLATSLVLTLRSWRVKFATDTVRLPPSRAKRASASLADQPPPRLRRSTKALATAEAFGKGGKPDTTSDVRTVRLPPSLDASADRRSLSGGGRSDQRAGA